MSSTIPQTMRALVQVEGHKAEIKEVPVPQLEKNEVLIKVDYVAQNPTDWKHVAWISQPGAIIGCDYAGTVVKLGSDLAVPLQLGDKVAGWAHGAHYTDRGAYAQYARIESDLTFKIPEGLKGEEAATFGIGWGTACYALIQSQEKAFPPAKVADNTWYLVYGASSSVGLFAVSLAKAMGYKVLGVASPHSFSLVKSYGADEVIDYHDVPQAIAQGQKITGGVEYALDAISEQDSIKVALGIMGDKGKKLTTLLPPRDALKDLKTDVKVEPIMLYTVYGREVVYAPWLFAPQGGKIPAVPKDRAFGVDYFSKTPDLIKQFGIKPNPVKLRGGLDDILAGFEEMKAGKVSGVKYVYKID